MRLLHLSDLHLGKRVCEFSMLDDQRYILEQILSLLDSSPVDAVLLAGDLYDKPVPPAEAVRLVQQKLNSLGEKLTTDGKYGASTVAAVQRYQRRNGLTADGSVGKATWEKMF